MICSFLSCTNEQRGFLQFTTQVGRQYGGYLCQRAQCTIRQILVASIGNPAHAKYQRIEFFGSKHQGWKHETRRHDIADSWFPLNGGSLGLEAGDVPVERTDADTDFMGQDLTAHGTPMTSQDLQET